MTATLYRSHQANARNAEAASASECERAMRRRLCVFPGLRTTTKRGYGCASVAVRAEKRANKNVKIRLLFSETETAKQNQKFPFHFYFRFAAEGWGEEAREKCKEIFWFLHTRVRERVRGALVSFTTQSERTMQFQATTRSARAIQSSSGFWSKYIRTLSNTHRNKSKSKCGRAEGTTLGLNSRQTQSPPRFSTLRVAQKVRLDP